MLSQAVPFSGPVFSCVKWKIVGIYLSSPPTLKRLSSYKEKRCKVSSVYWKNTEWAPPVCSLGGPCCQCANSNSRGCLHLHACGWLPSASTSHCPARGFFRPREHPHPAYKKGPSGRRCCRSGRLSSPASSGSGGGRRAPHILLEPVRGVEPQLPSEVACSLTHLRWLPPLSHFLTL